MSDSGPWRGYHAGGARSGKDGDRGGQAFAERSGLDAAFGRRSGGEDGGKSGSSGRGTGRKGGFKGNDEQSMRRGGGGGFKGGSRDDGNSWANSSYNEGQRFGGGDNWREEPSRRQDHGNSDRKGGKGYKGGSRDDDHGWTNSGRGERGYKGGPRDDGDSWTNRGQGERRDFGGTDNWRKDASARQDDWDSDRKVSNGYKGGSRGERDSWASLATNSVKDHGQQSSGGSRRVPNANSNSWRPELRDAADGGHYSSWREEGHHEGDTKGYGGSKGDSRGKGDASNGKASKAGKADGKGSKTGKADGKGSKTGKADGKSSKNGKANGKGNEAGKANGNSRGKKGSREASGHAVADDDEDEDEQEAQDKGVAPVSSTQRGSRGTGVVSSSHLSETTFSSLPISAATKRAMAEGFGYEFMTEVQAAAIFPLLEGKDVVARARTGTGKTLAFLIPIIERIRGSPAGVGGAISALVLSPTRELAQQIADEAKELLEYHSKLGVVCFYGGTNINSDRRDLANRPCDLLVATPGRIQDHLENTSGFQGRIQSLKFLALDEGDQLLDMGFRDSILRILRMLPSAGQRQGALFSATFPASVGEIAKLALQNHTWLDTVNPDEEVTPDQIDQSVAISTIEDMVWYLWAALSAEIARHPKSYKIMVFFVAARLTQFYSELFTQAGTAVFEIHSRKSQAHRTKAAESFRTAQRGIVFSSDVLARGLDFPDITAVIQVGVPSSRDQYIHRLGRTGRAGKSGRCILLLHDFEQYFLRTVKDLPVQRLPADDPWPGTRDPPDALYRAPDFKTGCQAYQAWLGYYNSAKGLGWPKDRLVQEATRFAEAINVLTDEGLPPPITKKTVGNMGLKGVAGLNLVSQLPYGD